MIKVQSSCWFRLRADRGNEIRSIGFRRSLINSRSVLKKSNDPTVSFRTHQYRREETIQLNAACRDFRRCSENSWRFTSSGFQRERSRQTVKVRIFHFANGKTIDRSIEGKDNVRIYRCVYLHCRINRFADFSFLISYHHSHKFAAARRQSACVIASDDAFSTSFTPRPLRSTSKLFAFRTNLNEIHLF